MAGQERKVGRPVGLDECKERECRKSRRGKAQADAHDYRHEQVMDETHYLGADGDGLQVALTI